MRINKSRYIPDNSRVEILSGVFGIFTRGNAITDLTFDAKGRFATVSHKCRPSASVFFEISDNISVSDSAKPCARASFSNLHPRPKTFLHCIKTGRVDFSALSKARSIASTSFPRTDITLNPSERIRALTSRSVCATPSMDNLLSSHNTIKLSRFKRPANESDSNDTPSIKSPSETTQKVCA